MGTSNQNVLWAILRNDFTAFTHRCFQTVVPGQLFKSNWHVEAIAYQLERIQRGEVHRLLVSLPPRSLKSICVSVAFPAFLLGHDPTRRIVCASYSQELAVKHARDCRGILESDWYRQIFPRTRINPRKNTEAEFETTAKGYRYTTSVGGTLTGRGGNLIIIDDPLKPSDAASETNRSKVNEWFDSTLLSRLDQKSEDAIIITMQRLHVDDLAGHVLTQGRDWVHLSLPAIAEQSEDIAIRAGRSHHRRPGDLLHPERESLSELSELKDYLGRYRFSAQYQQAPVPLEGAIIKRDWFRRYTNLPHRNGYTSIVQSWDTASKASLKNDYSVCTTGLSLDQDYYLIDVLRERLEYPDLLRRIVHQAQRYRAEAVLIEDAGSGTSLIQALTVESPLAPIAIRPEGDKIARLEASSALIEGGHVFLPQSAPWLDDFLLELLGFPNSKFDDQVDSFSQFLTWRRMHHDRPELVFI